jgi:hypothetical protein
MNSLLKEPKNAVLTYSKKVALLSKVKINL